MNQYETRKDEKLDMSKEKILESAVIGNIGHIVIVFITFLLISLLEHLKPLGIYYGLKSTLLMVVFVLTLLFWFYIGVRSASNNSENIYGKGIIAAIICVLPAGFFTILSQVLGTPINKVSDFTQWNIFYMVGGPTLFWHRPFSFVGELIAGNNLNFNGYIMLNINLILVAAVVFLGSIFFGKSKRGV
ncbi:hypothetical protein NSA47_09685 [Irregularibacter muris]|uniref:Uncharacterized protein n=1 Tax=Irregularibacter muris TaxID=1796619 RepID=A0AAE3HET1_9FIRM|nr:hypothetical protein [Irregularibacter muris]MCR1899256.1 hypothetical protein [Irregularibacter muris]